MIKTKKDLFNYIKADSINYESVCSFSKWRILLSSSPISDQIFIWRYIKTLRYCEYHTNNTNLFHRILSKWYLYKLRKISRITGFQIPPNVLGKGVTIWHWGPIIINPIAKIGDNCTLNPMVIIGHKNPGEPAPVIGDNVFIGGGAKIIGNLKIGNNVIIAPNSVVVKDIDDYSVVGGVPGKIIRTNK